jgi:uncharacterized protein YxjI
MALGRRRHDDATKFMMRERRVSVGDDYWIEDQNGDRRFKVNGKVARIRDTWALEDMHGATVARIRERKLSVRDAIEIDGHDLKVHGNIVDHEYEIESDGDRVATVSKKWFRARDTYGVEVQADADVVLILAVTVAVDALAHD